MKKLAALCLALPLPAFAHVGDHSHAGVAHFLAEPDHLAMVLGAAVVVGLVISKLRSRP